MNTPTFISPIKKTTATGLTLATSCVMLVSCQTNLTSGIAGKSIDKVAGLWPSRVPIAEVRNKDLKKMASGADRALAWNQSLNQWVYLTPVDYNPASMPDEPTYPVDGGLLPPLHPEKNDAVDQRGQNPEE